MRPRPIPRVATLTCMAIGLSAGLIPGWPVEPAQAQMKLYAGGTKRNAAARGSLPGDSRNGGGLAVAPRYLNSVGEFELGLDSAFVLSAAPSGPAAPFLPQGHAAFKILPWLDAQAVLGPTTRIGARGPLFQNEVGAVGWSAGYRSDAVPTGKSSATGRFTPGNPPPGVGAPLLGLGWSPGLHEARGAEARLEALQTISTLNGSLEVSLSPGLLVTGNRTGTEVAYGIDLDLDRFVVGYAGALVYNFLNPYEPILKSGVVGGLNPVELHHGLGGRILLNDRFYFHAHYRLVPSDTYYNQIHTVMAGIGFRGLAFDPGDSGPDSRSESPDDTKDPDRMKTSR